jgi:hypothetical protein
MPRLIARYHKEGSISYRLKRAFTILDGREPLAGYPLATLAHLENAWFP